jgi:hypothetical protein
MPTVYWVGDSEHGSHHKSLTEAMKEAREVANIRGFEIEVVKYTIPKLDLGTFINALNEAGWATDRITAAMVQPRGRKK